MHCLESTVSAGATAQKPKLTISLPGSVPYMRNKSEPGGHGTRQAKPEGRVNPLPPLLLSERSRICDIFYRRLGASPTGPNGLGELYDCTE